MSYDFDLIVIGAGAAGLVASTAGSFFGAKTALIEKDKLGGDCTWHGCVPSKAFLKSAQVFLSAKKLGAFGLCGFSGIIDTGKVMAHVREVVDEISRKHPVELFEKRGIKVLFGAPEFIDSRTIQLNGRRISSKRFIIATGSRPLIPDIEGLSGIEYLTNENVFDLDVLPRSLAILGAGPIGVEMAQAFSMLGAEIFLIEVFEDIMYREDKDVSKCLADIFTKEGIKIYTKTKVKKFLKENGSIKIMLEDKSKKEFSINCERLLVATGRLANVTNLNLEKIGLEHTKHGIKTNKALQTNLAGVYAAGDCVGPYRFSHIAEYQAILAVINALFPFKIKLNYDNVAWCTFTQPEIAHLGLTEEEAQVLHKNVKIYKTYYKDNDRAVTDLEKEGFCKVICGRGGKVLGAHIIGARAGELMHEYALLKKEKLKLSELSSLTHIYPTFSQVVKNTADSFYLEKFSSGRFKNVFKLLMKLVN
ncbi:MAG: NAD(P)/FAD-dependent oxidoreductase [Candidatus Omnitrophica bacterium]|nr:NAD(P)/FAD-dependent oxidoreductase [Candidatus Omnitrophota bacterium]